MGAYRANVANVVEASEILAMAEAIDVKVAQQEKRARNEAEVKVTQAQNRRSKRRKGGKFHGAGYSKIHGGLTHKGDEKVAGSDHEYWWFVERQGLKWGFENAQKKEKRKVETPSLRDAKTPTEFRRMVENIEGDLIGGDVGLIQLVLEAEEIRNELRQSIEKAREKEWANLSSHSQSESLQPEDDELSAGDSFSGERRKNCPGTPLHRNRGQTYSLVKRGG